MTILTLEIGWGQTYEWSHLLRCDVSECLCVIHCMDIVCNRHQTEVLRLQTAEVCSTHCSAAVFCYTGITNYLGRAERGARAARRVAEYLNSDPIVNVE